MRRRCDVNRSLWFWASIVCLRFIAERWSANGRGFSQGRANASRRATLTGSSPVCMLFRKTKAKQSVRSIRFAKKVAVLISDSRKMDIFRIADKPESTGLYCSISCLPTNKNNFSSESPPFIITARDEKQPLAPMNSARAILHRCNSTKLFLR